MRQILGAFAFCLLLTSTFANAHGPYSDSGWEVIDADDADGEQVVGPQVPSRPASSPTKKLNLVGQKQLVQKPNPDAEAHAAKAKEAATVAMKAANVANKVAAHSVKIIGHSKSALKHALGALHDARVESSGLDGHQKESLKKAEAHLREATKTADYGKLKKVKNAQDLKKEKMQQEIQQSKGMSEKEQMRRETQELRKKLREKNVDDKDVNKQLDDLDADLEKNKEGTVNDESKAELERLRQSVDNLEPEPVEKADDKDDKKDKTVVKKEKDVQSKALPDSEEAEESVTPVQEKGIDIDTQMPYGDLEPFGREDTAQELTESSVRESDEMVDQLERAEVAEEKRSVFRALTRLRGAAITSFDGVARSQTGNIDEYNKIHKWRKTHPLHHLADEESDVSKWAFPDNAD